jgi:hypothetical protein
VTQPRFKVGDRVRRINCNNGSFQKVGQEDTIIAVTDDYYKFRSGHSHISGDFCNYDLVERVYPCIQEIPPSDRRRVIVSGKISNIFYTSGYLGIGICVRMGGTYAEMDSKDLREAAAGFIVLAEVLEENSEKQKQERKNNINI